MSKIAVWINAFRLRTLPLALSSTFVGSFLAVPEGKFKWQVLFFSALTTTFLQILSNLANDYGDSKNGVDNDCRVGPVRAVQSGKISLAGMKRLVIAFIVLSLASGLILIYYGLTNLPFVYPILFLAVGISAIIAAVKYTVGKNPYGYSGFGDPLVFLFFGLVGVCGTYYLHTNYFNAWTLLPAGAIGLLSTGVINLNNMRDIENDSLCGKRTLVVRMGQKNAKIYHTLLIIFAILISLLYTLIFWESIYQLLFLLTLPFLFLNIKTVLGNKVPMELNVELKKLALTTFAFSLSFGIGLIL